MKILIPSVTCGGGHMQAASALEETWKIVRPEDTVRKVDVLDFTPRIYKKIYSEGYVKLIQHAPEVYSHYFEKTDDPSFIKRMTPLRRITSRFMANPFVKYLKEFSPDLMVCPHFLPLEIMGALGSKHFKKRKPKVVCVVTDFEAHALWMEPCVDLYCVAAEETKARLVARGVSEKKVIPTGIPVSLRFSSPINAKKVRKGLGFRNDQKTLLVLGGGFGMGPLPQIVKEADRMKVPFQIVVVAGKNEKLKRILDSKKYRHPMKIFGFTHNMHELMAASDLILTKPGGLTTSESLAMGKPLFIFSPIPGQESANSDFLLERGAAIKANRIEDIPFRLEQILHSPKLALMTSAAKSLGHPRAAVQIIQEAVKLA